MKVFATVYKLTDLADFLQLERQVDAHFKCRFGYLAGLIFIIVDSLV